MGHKIRGLILLTSLSVCIFLFCRPLTLFADEEQKKIFKVGLAVLHDNADYYEGRRGFVSFLESQKGIVCEFKLLDAYGDTEAYAKGLKRFIEIDQVDLIFTTGTRSTLPLMEISGDVPVIFTAVANPVQSGIAQSLESSANNFTGTHCGVHAKPQIQIIKKILPDVTTLGIIYTENESNAEIQTADFIEAAALLGLEVVTATVSKDSSSVEDVEKAARELVGKADIFIAHQDTSLSLHGRGMIKVAEENNLPTYVTLNHLLSQGAFISLGIDFHELGRLAGEKALYILRDKKNPKDIPITSTNQFSFALNLGAAKKINIRIPIQIIRTASKVIK